MLEHRKNMMIYKAKTIPSGMPNVSPFGNLNMPRFNGEAAGMYKGLIDSIHSDTENKWDGNTSGVLDAISNFQPEAKKNYADEAFGRIMKNYIGTSWFPAINEGTRDILGKAYTSDVNAHDEATDIKNASAVNQLVGHAMQQMENVKNPIEATSIMAALTNLGAKVGSTNAFDNLFLNPSQALSAKLSAINGLATANAQAFNASSRNYLASLKGGGTLQNNFSKYAGQNFGNEGCGYAVQALLEGNPLASIISPDCEQTLSNAQSKGLLMTEGNPGYGDAVLLKNPKDSYAASHIVLSDGHGGWIGNSSSKAEAGEASLSTGSMSDFSGWQMVGYIPTGQGFAQANANSNSSSRSTKQKEDPSDTIAKEIGYGTTMGALQLDGSKKAASHIIKAWNAAYGNPAAQQAVATQAVEYYKGIGNKAEMEKWNDIASRGASVPNT